MCKRGRKCISRTDEPSVSINLRLPQSMFDHACRDARRLSDELGEEISLPEYIRRRLPGEVNEALYGAWDGRASLDSREIDAILDFANKRAEQRVVEALAIAEDAIAHAEKAAERSWLAGFIAGAMAYGVWGSRAH